MIQSKFKVVWEGDVPSLTANQITDLQQEVNMLEDDMDGDASNLIFHTVAVDPKLGYDGPLIYICGQSGVSDTWFYEYDASPTWITEKIRDGEIVDGG